MVLPEEIPEFEKRLENNYVSGAVSGKKEKGMDWKDLTWFAVPVFVGAIAATLCAFVLLGFVPQTQTQLQDINSQLKELKQGQGVLFQGEVELARGLQDINSKISLNEQALQSLDYLSKNCQRTDLNDSFVLRCWK